MGIVNWFKNDLENGRLPIQNGIELLDRFVQILLEKEG